MSKIWYGKRLNNDRYDIDEKRSESPSWIKGFWITI